MNAIVARQFSSFRGNALLLFACLLLAQLTAAGAVTELQFSAATYEVTELEWSSPLKIKVTATPPPTNEVEVTLSRSGGTAGLEDFGRSLPWTVFISPGSSFAEVFLAGVDDGLPEPDETLNLRLSSPTDGAVLGNRSEALVTIHNTTAWMEFRGVSASEDGMVSIYLVRRGDTNAAVTLNYTTGTGGTATPGMDFTPAAGQIAFAPGVRMRELSLNNFLDDGEVEFTETMELRFAIASGEATLSQTNLFVGIADNEYPANLDLNFVPPTGSPLALAVQADGKILLAGWDYQVNHRDTPLLRLNADGTLDSSFRPQVDFEIYNVGVTGDGRILVGGTDRNLEDLEGLPRLGLARLWPDGRLDPTFKPDAGVVAEVVSNSSTAGATFQKNGKVLLGNPFRLRRLNADGSADEVFNAFARQDPNDEDRSLVAEQADGRMLIEQFVENEYQLRRLNSDGSPDPTFQPDPEVFSPLPLADGRIAAWSAGVQGLVRLRADGTVDPTFDATFLKPFGGPCRG